MRILHVTPGVSPRFGGPNNLVGLVRNLIKHGVDSTLITTNSDYQDRLNVPLNVPVVRQGAPHVFHHVWSLGGRYGFSPALARTLRRTVREYDLVHIHWLYNFCCIAAARAATSANVPYIAQPHGTLDPHVRARNWVVKDTYMATVGRPLLRNAAAVVFDTIEEARLASYAPRRPEWVTPVGIDDEDFAQLPAAGAFRRAFPQITGPFLLFLGRLSPQKALDLLLPAFARVAARRPDLSLVLAGPDYRGHEAEVRRMIGALGLGDRVIITGLLTHDQKLAALVDAERFVLTSYWENFGAVVAEALLCGLPPIVSDHVNIHEELREAGLAAVVGLTVDEIAAGIESSLDDTRARQRVSATGPAFVKSRYTWSAIVPPLIDRYAELIHTTRVTADGRAHGKRLHV